MLTNEHENFIVPELYKFWFILLSISISFLLQSFSQTLWYRYRDCANTCCFKPKFMHPGIKQFFKKRVKRQTCFQLSQNKQLMCVVEFQKTKFSYLVHQRKMEVVMIFFFTEKSWIPWQNTNSPKPIWEQATTYQRSNSDSFCCPERYSSESIAQLPAVFGQNICQQRGAETLSWRVTLLACSLIFEVCLLAMWQSVEAESSRKQKITFPPFLHFIRKPQCGWNL